MNNNYLELINENTLLNLLPAETIKSHLSDGSLNVSSYEKNNILHFSGETCLKLEIILSGRVVVDRIDEAGNLMTIAEFFSDEILGGNILFSKNPYYPMTITAKQKTIILEIKKNLLLQLFSEHNYFLRCYLEFVSDHATILGNRIKHYVNKTIRESILSYLSYESKRQNSNQIKLNITKKALAEKIGVQRTSISRELTKMRDDGLIKFEKNIITLLKQ